MEKRQRLALFHSCPPHRRAGPRALQDQWVLETAVGRRQGPGPMASMAKPPHGGPQQLATAWLPVQKGVLAAPAMSVGSRKEPEAWQRQGKKLRCLMVVPQPPVVPKGWYFYGRRNSGHSLGLVWQRMAKFFSSECSGRMGSGAEACHSSKLCRFFFVFAFVFNKNLFPFSPNFCLQNLPTGGGHPIPIFCWVTFSPTSRVSTWLCLAHQWIAGHQPELLVHGCEVIHSGSVRGNATWTWRDTYIKLLGTFLPPPGAENEANMRETRGQRQKNQLPTTYEPFQSPTPGLYC